ncbi:MAG: outer membrane protein assembly factor BamA, partial [Candidatus Paceibacteria bacterium]
MTTLIDLRRPLAHILYGLLVCAWMAPCGAFASQVAAGPSQDPWENRTILLLEVEGENRYSEDRLRAALGVQVGQSYSAVKVERGIDYLWSLFQVRARLSGRLSEEGLELVLKVVELPSDLEPRFIGYDEINLEEILEWAQLQDNRELYFHQVPRVTGRLLDGYHQEGHFFAEVDAVIRDPQEGDDPDAPGDVIFEIVEGPQVNVTDVVIHGNTSLPETGSLFWSDGLKHLSQNVTKGPSLFDWNGAEYIDEDLRSDLVAMRNVYRERGYLN